MYLIANQPIYEHLVADNLFNGIETKKSYFGLTEYIYIQWLIGSPQSNCHVPSSDTEIQIYTQGGVLVKNMGLYSMQYVNKDWFTLKFKFSDLSLQAGCYYIKWSDCPSGTSTVHTSNVFEVLSDTSATKLITASCDCYGHGFDWSAFILQWRVPFAIFNPEYDLKSEDDINSDEYNTKYYAERHKRYKCRTAPLDEGEHDALTVALLCDTLLVQGVEYYLDKKDYNMENDKDGQYQTFTADFELKKQKSTTVNNNCKDCSNEIYPYYGY